MDNHASLLFEPKVGLAIAKKATYVDIIYIFSYGQEKSWGRYWPTLPDLSPLAGRNLINTPPAYTGTPKKTETFSENFRFSR